MLNKLQMAALGAIAAFALCIDGCAEAFGIPGLTALAVIILGGAAVILLISDHVERRPRRRGRRK